MPSPVGHLLGGLIAAFAVSPYRTLSTPSTSSTSSTLSTLSTLGIVGLAAIAPDFDFLWGRHSMETHSVTAAVLAGLAAFAWKRDARLAVAVAFAWASHVLFDWLGSDTTPPIGVRALWPFDSGFYFAHAYLFEAISRRYWMDNFVAHNTWAVVKEVLMLGPIALAAWWLARRRTSSGQNAGRS